ncbi:MAG TPA: ABC transporter permease [Longimicrobiales bacterium]
MNRAFSVESFKEGASLAIDQLRANKFRSALTILGIVVGVATVMAMSALVAGIRNGIMTEVNALGPKNFMFARWDQNQVRISDDNKPPWGDNPKVTIQEVLSLSRLPAVKEAVPGADGWGVVVAGGERIPNVPMAGRGAGWSNFTTGKIIAGHDFLPSDVAAASNVAVITVPLAEKLFGTLDPIGRTIRLENVNSPNGGKAVFRVIGVFQQAANIFASIQKHFVVLPYTAGLKHLGFDDQAIAGLVVTAPNASQEDAMDQVRASIRVRRGMHPGEADNFVVIKQENLLKTFNKITGIFFLVMISLSSVALMVGGVGVVAIMTISVTERTREIGVRKALGATQREILFQFLFESITVTFIGGAIGMMLGGLLAFGVSALTPLQARVPMGGIIAALGMATVAGVLFGLWPAWRAARMDPVVALRYE